MDLLFFCDLRYNQYTFAATFQSGSYNLQGDCTDPMFNGNSTFCQQFFSIYNCYYENQGGRDIVRQLKDGIREFDLVFCADTINNNDVAELCKDVNGTIAIGDNADIVFQQIAEYMAVNPGEIVSLELSTDDPPDLVAPYLIDRLKFRFGDMMLNRPLTTWPTLGQMVQYNKRLVVFFSLDLYDALGTPPSWVFLRANYYYPSQQYTIPALDSVPDVLEAAAELPGVLQDFCDFPDTAALQNRWMTLDFEYPELDVCPSRVDNIINQQSDEVALHCLTKAFFHRVRLDNYFIGAELKRLVYRINLARWMMLTRNLLPENMV